MKTKREIVQDWLPRYTERACEDFSPYLLLTNFDYYLHLFAKYYSLPIEESIASMPTLSADGITIVNFGMGSPNAATIMDLLSAIQPKAVLFLGKCGGLKEEIELGNYILPLAGIRGEGTSDDYMPKEVPSLPSFIVLKAISIAMQNEQLSYHVGSVYTTNRRVWEYDLDFRSYLKKTHADGIDMETATLFTTAYANKIPLGALLMVSDCPMKEGGVKTGKSDKKVTAKYSEQHLKLGIQALKILQDNERSQQGIHFDW